MHYGTNRWLVPIVLALTTGCGRHPYPPAGNETDSAAIPQSLPVRAADHTPAAANAIPLSELAGLERLMQVSDGIYCGGQPQGEPAFQSLAKLGIKTVVSVDDDRFKMWLAESEGLAEALEMALKAGAHTEAARQLQLLEKSCNQCHAQYRN
jgi:hypothetical protein